MKKSTQISLSVLVLAIVAVAIYSSYELYRAKDPTYAQKLADAEAVALVEKVGKLIDLPSEKPQVAIVKDAEIVKKSEPFFVNVENGDRLLMYSDRVILYRPSDNKLVNVGPRLPSPETGSGNGGQAINEAVETTVELRNGSNTLGKAREFEQGVIEAEFQVIAVESASRKDYESISIYNVKSVDVSRLESLYKVKAQSGLPEGEKETDASVLVIVGN